MTGVAPLAAVDRGRGILEDKGDPLIGCAELAEGAYSPTLLAAIDAGLSFRGDDRPIDITACRALMDGVVPTSGAVASTRAVAHADEAEIETVVADSVRNPEPAEVAVAPKKKRWYRRKRVWLTAVVVFVLLANEEETTEPETKANIDPIAAPTDDIPMDVGTPIRDAVTDHDDPPDPEPSASDIKKPVVDAPKPQPEPVPIPVAASPASEAVQIAPPVPEPPPPVVVVEETPVKTADDLAQEFEAAVVAGDYTRAEGLVGEARELGANPRVIAQAKKSIEAHKELTEVVELIQSDPRVLPSKRVEQAIERAGQAMDDGKPGVTIAIAKRLRREFERKARRKRR